MKKLIVVILSISMCFSMVGCSQSEETRGQLAYENIKTACEIAMSLKVNMESIPNSHDYDFFTLYKDNDKIMSNAAWGLIYDSSFGVYYGEESKTRLVGSAFMSVIKDEYGKDFPKEIKANTTTELGYAYANELGYMYYFFNYSECRYDLDAQSAALTRTIIRVYERIGKIGKAERALAEADKQLQKLKNEDYEHYEALKKYYDSTTAFFDRARLSEVGSDFDSTFEALENYEDDTRNLYNIADEYEDYLDDVFGES
jgi:lipoprotein